MKIAIHNRPGSFSDRWIAYCEENNISHKIVNCYDSDILEQLINCDGLMWHWHHGNYREQNFARQLICSVEKMGLKVFPNYNTCWHFDDKVGQKYLLESINAPLVPSFVFYDTPSAHKWADEADFPIVFKLRGGAGAQNVKLINSKNQAKKLIRRAFGRGFPLVSCLSGLKQQVWVLKRDKNIMAVIHLIAEILRVFHPNKGLKLLPRQKGYIYFQEFFPNQQFDDRVIIIGERAIAIKRYNRANDFRASGSGLIDHNPELINTETIKVAFQVAKRIGSQSLAFDFLYNASGNPYIVEISYCYAVGPAYDNCPGYWDTDLNWNADNVDPQRYIIEDFIQSLK